MDKDLAVYKGEFKKHDSELLIAECRESAMMRVRSKGNIERHGSSGEIMTASAATMAVSNQEVDKIEKREKIREEIERARKGRY
jgi:hypothetical protein